MSDSSSDDDRPGGGSDSDSSRGEDARSGSPSPADARRAAALAAEDGDKPASIVGDRPNRGDTPSSFTPSPPPVSGGARSHHERHVSKITAAKQALLTLKKEVSETHPVADLVFDEPKDLAIARHAVVRIQSLYRGASLRRLLIHSDAPIEGVNEQRRGIWRLNKRRGEAVQQERSPAQLLPPRHLSHVFLYLTFGEVVRAVVQTCKQWAAGARAPSKRQAMMTLVTHASLRRVWDSKLLAHIGAIHTSLRVCVSPLALGFDLFQSYFDLNPKECIEIAARFTALVELVGCVRHDSVNSLVPQSPIGIHGHLYGGRTGQPSGSEARRQSLLPGGGIIPGGSRGTLARASQVHPLGLDGSKAPSQPLHVPVFAIAFPKSLKRLVLEIGLPALQANVAVKEIGLLMDLEQLTLLTISEVDISPLLVLSNLRSLSVRYSNLTGKTTRLRFPRRTQYAVLRRLSQLTSLEVEEGFLVDPPAAQQAKLSREEMEKQVRGCYLHELLLGEEATPTVGALVLPPISGASPASPSNGSKPSSALVHQLRLQHLHMEKTTLLRGNEAALTTLPTLTSLTPFRFAYDCNFSFLRSLRDLTALHLHFSTSASPPPPMLPLMSALMTCTRLTELSLRGMAFGPSEQLLLLTYLQQIRLAKFKLAFCTLPSLKCLQVLSPTLTSLTLDSCVCLALDPADPTGGTARHVLFTAADLQHSLARASRLEELYLNGTFEVLPYSALQMLTYPSPLLPALQKLVLTAGSVMLSSYDQRRVDRPEEVTLELAAPARTAAPKTTTKKTQQEEDDSDDDAPPMLFKTRQSVKRHSARPGFHPPGLRR